MNIFNLFRFVIVLFVRMDLLIFFRKMKWTVEMPKAWIFVHFFVTLRVDLSDHKKGQFIHLIRIDTESLW